jgi:hypothetical protein
MATMYLVSNYENEHIFYIECFHWQNKKESAQLVEKDSSLFCNSQQWAVDSKKELIGAAAISFEKSFMPSSSALIPMSICTLQCLFSHSFTTYEWLNRDCDGQIYIGITSRWTGPLGIRQNCKLASRCEPGATLCYFK